MDQFRRAALIVGAVLTATAAHAPGIPARLIAGDGGRLQIVAGGRGATLAPVIAVEQRDGDGWHQVSEIGVTGSCSGIGAELGDAPVRLAPAQVLDVVRWRGWTCEAQCPRLCGVNVYLGPGRFRFVARATPGDARMASGAFTMPEREAALGY